MDSFSDVFSDSLIFFDTLSGAHSFRDCFACLFMNLSTLLDILNLLLVISHNVALLHMGNLHYCSPSWGYQITCPSTQPDTGCPSWSPTCSLVSCHATVLSWVLEHFFLYPVLYSISSLGYTFRYSLCYTAACN